MTRLTAAERQKRYREKHPEKVTAYRAANKKRQDAEYRERNKDKIKERTDKWLAENKERDKENKRRWYKEHKVEVIQKVMEWQENNSEKLAMSRYINCGKRRATKVQATPAWANKFFISEIYDLAKRRNKLNTGGVKWHVDHIIPLKSPLVCGLHVEHNLQVIPAIENQSKSNKFCSEGI